MLKTAFPAAIALILPILLAWLGLSRALGAHPFWEVQTIAIGAPIGVALGFAMQWGGLNLKVRLITLVALLLGAMAVATYGKAEFVASYADDRLAGQLWFFGWIAVGVFTSATLFAVLRRK